MCKYGSDVLFKDLEIVIWVPEKQCTPLYAYASFSYHLTFTWHVVLVCHVKCHLKKSFEDVNTYRPVFTSEGCEYFGQTAWGHQVILHFHSKFPSRWATPLQPLVPVLHSSVWCFLRRLRGQNFSSWSKVAVGYLWSANVCWQNK